MSYRAISGRILSLLRQWVSLKLFLKGHERGTGVTGCPLGRAGSRAAKTAK
jgi:hypothetical protein